LKRCAVVLVATAPLRADAPAAQRFKDGTRALEYGDYEGVVSALESLAEDGAGGLTSPSDRIEAVRDYGIACAVLGHRVAAEGAFLLLLDERPDLRLDPELVPAKAVSLFESVRQRYPHAPPMRLRLSRPPETRAAAGLITGGAALGIVGVTVGLAYVYLYGASPTMLDRFDTTSSALIYTSVVAVASSVPLTAVGIVLLVRANRVARRGP
jgi:hypothetical protein